MKHNETSRRNDQGDLQDNVFQQIPEEHAAELTKSGRGREKTGKAEAGAQKQFTVLELSFQFPAAVEKQYGKIHDAEDLGAGVYYISTYLPEDRYAGGEYFLVTADSPAISDAAHAYGILLPTNPVTYLYSCEDYFEKGRWVVSYELHKYLTDQGIPLPDGESLQNDVARGMEVCPEHFGEFPIPTETPWGAPVQADKVGNGVFWLKTEQEGWVLSVACPVYDDINLDVQKRSLTMQVGLTKWAGNTCPYQFYPYCASCLLLLELIEFTNPGWAGKFSMPAIKNAILESFPEYAEWYNQNTSSQKEEIIYTADVGTVFYRFPD